MKKIVCFSLPGNEGITQTLANKMKAEKGKAIIHKFPDGETYIRILSDVKNKDAVLVCSLNDPDDKIVPIYFLTQTLRTLGAKKVCLVAPYLAYMRQDKIFNPGEGVTSVYFGKLISGFVDEIVTIDPHLHRIKSLSEIYFIPHTTIHVADQISNWIKKNIKNPVLIGPDKESKQWVSIVAKNAEAPFVVLNKVRYSDEVVKVSIPNIEQYKNATPVLVDDIISTGHTMIETVNHLKKEDMKPAICIGIHAIFAGNSYQELLDCGVAKIVTCNTIDHPSNAIDLTNILAKKILNREN
jgi:ribose-phosphate pyrophosphokinase